MSLIIEFNDPRTNQPWTARLIEDGDAHGNCMVLTHSGEPTIAFYDRRYAEKFAAYNGGNLWGQFVSSYYVSTLRGDSPAGPARGDVPAFGLNLHGGIESWSLSPEAMKLVFTWLDNVHPIPELELDVADGLHQGEPA